MSEGITSAPSGPRSEWPARTIRFNVDGHKGYMLVRFNGPSVAGLEIHMHRVGTTVHGLLTVWYQAINMMFDMCVPLERIVEKFVDARFEPLGRTLDLKIPSCTSIVDYAVRTMARLGGVEIK